MCSGCSGDFEGGDEPDLGHDEFDPWEPELTAGRGVASEQGLQPGSGGGDASAMRAVDDYEVLVTADAIIEKRTIYSKSRILNETRTSDVGEFWRESDREGEQPVVESARYYRTLAIFACANGSEAYVSGKCFLICALALTALMAGALWLVLG